MTEVVLPSGSEPVNADALRAALDATGVTTDSHVASLLDATGARMRCVYLGEVGVGNDDADHLLDQGPLALPIVPITEDAPTAWAAMANNIALAGGWILSTTDGTVTAVGTALVWNPPPSEFVSYALISPNNGAPYPGGTLPAWQSAHDYEWDDTDPTSMWIFADGSPWSLKTNGTSGSSEPDWSTAPAAGDDINDGDAVWTREPDVPTSGGDKPFLFLAPTTYPTPGV